MREQLLGYVLGALEEDETRQLEDHLARDGRLRRELVLLRRSLRPLKALEREFPPPTRLAARTCALVAASWNGAKQGETEPLQQPALAAAGSQPALVGAAAGLSAPEPDAAYDDHSSWGVPDVTVGLAIAAALMMLVIPAIHYSRFSSRITACQDNLRQLGEALVAYSGHHDDCFPTVPVSGRLSFAGMYAPTLLSNGYLRDPRWVFCPGAPLADAEDRSVPTVDQIVTEPSREARLRLCRTAGGSYGYTFSYEEDGRCHPLRNLGREHFDLMSDAPTYYAGRYWSLNHDGRGFNVLFESRRVVFVDSTRPDGCQDEIFLNDDRRVALGRNADDSVICSSGTVPVVP